MSVGLNVSMIKWEGGGGGRPIILLHAPATSSHSLCATASFSKRPAAGVWRADARRTARRRMTVKSDGGRRVSARLKHSPGTKKTSFVWFIVRRAHDEATIHSTWCISLFSGQTHTLVAAATVQRPATKKQLKGCCNIQEGRENYVQKHRSNRRRQGWTILLWGFYCRFELSIKIQGQVIKRNVILQKTKKTCLRYFWARSTL